jgi:hypothetical protein
MQQDLLVSFKDSSFYKTSLSLKSHQRREPHLHSLLTFCIHSHMHTQSKLFRKLKLILFTKIEDTAVGGNGEDFKVPLLLFWTQFSLSRYQDTEPNWLWASSDQSGLPGLWLPVCFLLRPKMEKKEEKILQRLDGLILKVCFEVLSE